MRHKRIVRRTLGKDPIKKSQTLLSNTGQGSSPAQFELISVPGRTTDGASQIIRDDQDTSTKANVGDIIKYVNIVLQIANQDANVEPNDTGWLEWAVTFEKEKTTAIPSTFTGVQTLQALAMRIFRGDCLLTGQVPIGSIQPMVEVIKIKIPKNKIKLQLGSSMQIHTFFRSADSADVRTTNIRLVQTCFYKLYV